jgi:hypothetical protein
MKMVKERGYAEAAPAEATDQPTIGTLVMTIVTRRSVPILGGGFGSIGGVVDAHMEEAAMGGEEVRDVTVEVGPEFWSAFAARVNENNR